MAFQQPQQRPQPQLRAITHVRQSSDQQQQQQQPQQLQAQQAPASPSRKRTLDESQEWILFSPAPCDSQSRTSGTPRTATQYSEFGSLQTHVRSQAGAGVEGGNGEAGVSAGSGEAAALERKGSEQGGGDNNDDDDDEDQAAELDSLDDGLHAFHHPFSASSTHHHHHQTYAHHLDQSGGTVLPRHDGFGMFPSSAGGGLQEQLWQFERHNPHRRRHSQHHRRSSVQRQLDVMEEEAGLDVDDERTARIEKWRLDQSRVVLEEIEKETRRRKRKMSRLGESVDSLAQQSGRPGSAKSRKQPGGAGSSVESTGLSQNTATQEDRQQNSESFWQRITRKVIQDLIGLDDTTLSVILGESLVPDSSPTPTQTSPIAAAASRESRVTFGDPVYSWEVKLLDRIARELGLLVTHLSGGGAGAGSNGLPQQHEGAFSTYLRSQEELDYAGLGRPTATRDLPPRQPSLRQQRRREQQQQQQQQQFQASSNHDPMFSPTLVQQQPPPLSSPSDAPDTSLWGIEEEPMQDVEEGNASQAQQATAAIAAAEKEEKEYWEREIDMKMILSYVRDQLVSRVLRHASFASPSSPAAATKPADTSGDGPLPAAWATTPVTTTTTAVPTSTDASHHLRRAELIRKQHPLISRAAHHSHHHHNPFHHHHSHSQQHQIQQQQRRQLHHEALLRRQQLHASSGSAAGLLVGSGGGRSSSCASQSTRRSRAALSRSASSRHFWDLGGSVSVHSAGAGSGGLGGWGEV